MTTLFDQPEKPMTTELAERPADLTPLAFVQNLIQAQDFDPERASKAMDLWERLERNSAAEAFGHALATFQARCPVIKKQRKIDLGSGAGPKYASLDDIMREITPLLAECGLAITFSATLTDDGKMRAVCNIRHGRHVEVSEVTLPVPAQMRVNDTQKMGAALSYAKRYALCAALNIVVSDEDRDGSNLTETIDEGQMVTIREWLESSGADEKKFLAWVATSTGAEVKQVADMPASFFLPALQELKRKASKR